MVPKWSRSDEKGKEQEVKEPAKGIKSIILTIKKKKKKTKNKFILTIILFLFLFFKACTQKTIEKRIELIENLKLASFKSKPI